MPSKYVEAFFNMQLKENILYITGVFIFLNITGVAISMIPTAYENIYLMLEIYFIIN